MKFKYFLKYIGIVKNEFNCSAQQVKNLLFWQNEFESKLSTFCLKRRDKDINEDKDKDINEDKDKDKDQF